ncbi:procathepsin L-like [Lineus longissimus]|uniref:procathepsin L-like n=1 Tax=Lineus longissimus TaxID=88925 RepID=UPI002B4C36C3
MFRSILCVCLFGIAFSATLLYKTSDDDWEAFKTTYSKKYTSGAEENVRQVVWRQNLKEIERHNLEADLGQHTFWMGLNEYSDWTTEEYKKYLNGFKGLSGAFPNNTKHFVNPGTAAPATVDWRSQGYVTPIKNQGQCGSCWAFSTTGTLEGQHFKKTGRLVSLSEQNLVDCAWPEGCAGCNGCWQRYAMEYIKTNPGVDTETCYPYHAKNGNCHFNPQCVGAELTGYVAIRQNDENDLKSATASIGPIAISIDASHSSFQQYRSGVYYESQCSSKSLDHAVLVVGYGTDNGSDYWLVKNSWGTTWGDNGYIKMARNRDNNCGVASYATYPTV